MPTPPLAVTSDLVHVAVVGYGYWGPNLVRNMAGLESARLRAICDLVPAARARAEETYPDVPVTSDLEAVLADPSIHAVVIATPAASHKALALQALQAGKHVLVEKPLTTTTADARVLIAEAAQRNLVLGVGHTFLHTGPVRAARAAIASSRIGRVMAITSRRENLGLHRLDANVIWDLMPHDVSILTHVVGQPIVRAAATGVESLIPQLTDIANCTLEFADGAKAFVVVSWLGHRKVREMAFIGTDGVLIYDDNEPEEKLRWSDRGADVNASETGRPTVRYREGSAIPVEWDKTEALRALCGNFIDAIQGRGTLVSDGRAGLAVVAVMEALERSRMAGGQFEEVENV